MVKNSDKLKKDDGSWYYEMQELGFNYRLTDIQSALGSSQLKKLDSFVEKRIKVAELYNKSFSDIPEFITPHVPKNVYCSYHLYALQINFSKTKISKSVLFEEMKKLGINLQVHYIPVHLQPYYTDQFGFKIGDYPISENFYQSEVSLPIYPDLDIKDQEFVIKNLLQLLIDK